MFVARFIPCDSSCNRCEHVRANDTNLRWMRHFGFWWSLFEPYHAIYTGFCCSRANMGSGMLIISTFFWHVALSTFKTTCDGAILCGKHLLNMYKINIAGCVVIAIEISSYCQQFVLVQHAVCYLQTIHPGKIAQTSKLRPLGIPLTLIYLHFFRKLITQSTQLHNRICFSFSDSFPRKKYVIIA